MDANEYLEQRLQPEIDWYDDKSSRNKWAHIITRGVEIICAALIPLLAGFANLDSVHFPMVTGALGVLIAAAAGFSSLLKFQENWLKYRTTAESLKKEKYLFLTKVEPYSASDPLTVLVQRVETLVSQENTNWAQYMMKPAAQEQGQETSHG